MAHPVSATHLLHGFVPRRSSMQLTASLSGTLAGVRLSTGAIYLIAAVPLIIAAMIASVIWRSAKRERSSRALRSRLESPNAQTRREALDKVTDEVLCIDSVMLSELLERETDPEVLDALAAAVARSKWEPTDDVALLQLRRWVAGGQGHASSSSNGGPAIAGEQAPAPASAAPSEPSSPLATADSQPSTAASVADAPDMRRAAEPARTPSTSGGVDRLVDKVREVLGDGVERVELISIDGELLTSWSSAQDASAPQASPDTREGA